MSLFKKKRKNVELDKYQAIIDMLDKVITSGKPKKLKKYQKILNSVTLSYGSAKNRDVLYTMAVSQRHKGAVQELRNLYYELWSRIPQEV